MDEITRTVAENYSEDEGRSIARLDPKTLLDLGIKPGDYIKISGELDTYVAAWRADRRDWEQDEIRIDRYTRYNAQAEVGDTVSLTDASLNPLDRALLMPYRDANIEFGGDATPKIKGQLISTPVRIGAVVSLLLSDDRDPFPLVVTGPSERNPGIITESTTVRVAEGYQSEST